MLSWKAIPMRGIRTARRRMVTALLYIMDGARPLGLPSDRYYQVFVEGYECFGFDQTILRKALLESKVIASYRA